MQAEIDTYDGCDFDRHAVDLVRSVSPRSHCVLCRTPQQAMTLDNLQMFHSSIL
jgi:hypothetical protein